MERKYWKKIGTPGRNWNQEIKEEAKKSDIQYGEI